MNENFEWSGFIIKLSSVLIPFTIAGIYAIKDFRKDSENKLRPIGYAVVILLVIALFLGILDYFNSLSTDYENEAKLQKELAKRDSINQAKNDLANQALYESFAKYGLKYDQAKQEIRRLVKDSARINYINAEKPYFYISNIKKEGQDSSKPKYKITFTSKSTSYNINASIDLIEFDSITTKLSYIQKKRPMLSGASVTEKEVTVSEIPLENVQKNIILIFFRLQSTYEDSSGKKISIDKIYSYHNTKGFTEPTTWVKKMVEDFIIQEKL